MDKVTQSNAASAEESASASQELFDQAKELGDMVIVLVGIVKGGSTGAVQEESHRMVEAPAPNRSGSSAKLRRPAPKTAFKAGSRSVSKPASKPASKPVNGGDWTPQPMAKAAHNGNGNGHAVRAESIIPLSYDDLKDF